MNDRTIGYISLSLPLLLALFIIGYLLFSKKSSDEIRTIEFDNILGLSFINIQDPVLVRGYQTGSIKSIITRNQKSIVTIVSKRPLLIHNDYVITVGAQGVMGDRFLNIDPGQQTSSTIPADRMLKGILLPSPPEAVAEMKQLIFYVKELRTISEGLLRGTGTKQSFVSTYTKVLNGIDSTLGIISEGSSNVSQKAPEMLDTLESLVTQASKLKNSLKTNIPLLLQGADTIIASGTDVTNLLDTVVSNSQAMLQQYKEQDFLKLEDFIHKTEESLCSLKVIIKDVREKGMYLPVRLW